MPGQVVVTAIANFVMGFGLCAFLDIMLRARRAARFRGEARARLDAVTPPGVAPMSSMSSAPAELVSSAPGRSLLDGADGYYGN